MSSIRFIKASAIEDENKKLPEGTFDQAPLIQQNFPQSLYSPPIQYTESPTPNIENISKLPRQERIDQLLEKAKLKHPKYYQRLLNLKNADNVKVPIDSNTKKEPFKFSKNLYASGVLFLILLVKIVNQWHRKSLTYAFGYKHGTGLLEPFFEISSSYPQLEAWYGTLAGLAYTLPYCIVGLFMGAITHRVNRKFLLGVTMMIGSISQFMMGRVDSFPLLCGMRVLHGSMNSATSPLTYSLVADYIPPEKRATANSILSSAIYLGIAMSSLSIMLIQRTGWRLAFQLMGMIGVGVGITSIFYIREPKRGALLEPE